jgi:hypothetical protein
MIKKTKKCFLKLPIEIAEKAFVCFKENPNKYISQFAEKGIVPNVLTKISTDDFNKWTLEEWATFLTFYFRGKKGFQSLYFKYPNVEE